MNHVKGDVAKGQEPGDFTMSEGSFATNPEMHNIFSVMEKLLHWAAIVDSSDDAIISKSMDGYITSWNRGAEKLYGYTASEIIGQPVTVLMPPEKADDFPSIMKLLREGKKVDHYHTRRKTKDGRVLDVSITVSPIRDPHGNIIGASKIARDISYQIEYLRRKSDLINAASHELNTPVATQRVYGELLQALLDKQGDEQAQMYIRRMNRQTQRLETLINNLLKADKGIGIQMNYSTFILEEFLVPLAEDLEAALGRKIIRKGNAPYTVKADEMCLSQVVTNLISNAAKYSPEDREIILSVNRSDGHVVIAVQDFGVGIEQQYQEKIFEKFYRQHEGSYPGMGLGLSLCKEVAEKHGGSIWVESEPGKGATFFFALPIKEEGQL